MQGLRILVSVRYMNPMVGQRRGAAEETDDVQLDLDRQARFDFHGSKFSSVCDVLLLRDLLTFSAWTTTLVVCSATRGQVTDDCSRRAVFGRLPLTLV